MRMEYIAGFGWLLLAPMAPLAHGEPPPIMLANRYAAAEIDVTRYWVSEKYDGIRAYWTGTSLLTRTGHLIHAPQWFTSGWPTTPLDGELWMGRGRFEALSSAVRDRSADDNAWRHVRFMVFDLPEHPGSFAERLSALTRLLSDSHPWLQVVEQFRVADETALHAKLDEITTAGAEGLMLHRDDAPYRAVRSDDLLKLKRLDDAEARVVGHVPGKGKYQGMLGALEVETPEGVRFRIGTGLDDRERREPPALGTWVTYGYQGLTERGIPRFARFLRVAPESIAAEPR